MEEQEKVGPVADSTVEKQKIKKRPKKKKFEEDGENTVKVDLTKLKEAAETVTKVDLSKVTEEDKVVADEKTEETVTEITEETKPEAEAETQEAPALEEITNEVEEVAVIASEAIKESAETGNPLPENIEKLMSFMEDTGGDLNDYVKLNKDYSEMDNLTLLKEYYKESKPHLDDEEIGFLMEDQFSFDEDSDDERDIRKKKIALKEQVADAKSHLDGLKSKYYEDIKMGSKLTSEQQDAINFFDRYKTENAETEAVAEKQKSDFLSKTNTLFGDKFKGFEYDVGDKKYRFNVKNANEVKNKQSDINNFVKKFLNKDGEVADAQGYHKSLYTAMNSDAIAKHFYEQGKADAMKDSVANAKNVDTSPRQSFNGEISSGGLTVKVLGEDSSAFKYKIKKKK